MTKHPPHQPSLHEQADVTTKRLFGRQRGGVKESSEPHTVTVSTTYITSAGIEALWKRACERDIREVRRKARRARIVAWFRQFWL